VKTIVVGYDDTEPSRRALARAAELAAALEGHVHVVSVAPLLVGANAARGIGPFDPSDSPELHREELRHAAELLEERGIAADYAVAYGEPADALVDYAASHDADLVVVGTREAGVLERIVAPSVGGSLGRHAHCDVLIVH
jgi:nucleotide-binding universal stress UspA family protein